ncbi:hypothetical protein N9K54_03405 [Candidatus Poseidonia alphae]|nr:hypothetical protein [Candidatus Poseidonia alphae]
MVTNHALRDLREAATKLKHRVDLEHGISDDGSTLSEESLKALMSPAIVWSQTCRSILIDFFTKSWDRASKKNLRNLKERDEEYEGWVDKIDTKLDESASALHPLIMMAPFNGWDEIPETKQPIEVRLNRLKTFFKLAFAKHKDMHEEIIKLLEDESKMFDLLLEYEDRKIVFRLKNISHVVDAKMHGSTSQNKLHGDLVELLSHEHFERNLEKVSKLMITLRLVVKCYDGSLEGKLIDRLTREMEKYHNDMSDTANMSRTKGLLKRIDMMKWGPKDFVRDKSVIDEAFERLDINGLLTLTGVGAVGKTALASKLLQISAQEDNFDRYITLSTKVNSEQLELDADSDTGTASTDSRNSLFHSLLNPKDKRISGSMNRLCRQIIKSVEPDWEFDDEQTQELITNAIDKMKQNSILICIDNFEDIEEPPKKLGNTEEGKRLLKAVMQEYKYFQNFFTKWSISYEQLRPGENKTSKRNTQVLITTRGRGEKSQNSPMQVPPLTDDENYQLFEAKLQARYKDGIIGVDVLEAIRGVARPNVIEAFNDWSLPKVDEELEKMGYKHQPAYTIHAAAGVKEVNGDKGVFTQIKKWDPQGKAAEYIRKYVTNKIFGGLEEIEIQVMGSLLGKGMNAPFEVSDIRKAVKTHGEEWAWAQGINFLRDFSLHRDFFIETTMNSRYIWNPFYYREIKTHFSDNHPDLLRLSDNEIAEWDGPEEIEEPVVKTEERKLIQAYLSTPVLDAKMSSDATFNTVIKELIKEKYLPDKDAAQSLIMLIGNDKLKAPEATLNSLFPAKPPSHNLFQKFKSAKTHAPKALTNARTKNVIVGTMDGKFVKSNFKYVWEYFQLISEEIIRLLEELNLHNLISRLYNVLHREAEECSASGLISEEDLLEFYKHALRHFNKISSTENAFFEKDLFESVSQDILDKYIGRLNVVPREIKEEITRGTEETEHYEAILDFVDRNLQYNGRQEDLLGKLFWLTLRHIASKNTPNETLIEGSEGANLRKVDEWLIQGARAVKGDFSMAFVVQKKEQVLKNFKQLVWTLDDLSDRKRLRGGGLSGKLIFYRRGEKFPRDMTIIVPRGDLDSPESYISDLVWEELASKRYPYRIKSINASHAYLRPILVDGRPIEDPGNLVEISSCKMEIRADYEDRIKNLLDPILWDDFKINIPHQAIFAEFIEFSEREQIEFYIKLIGMTEKTLDFCNVQRKFYVKPGTITSEEKESIVSYDYEKRFSNDVLKYITSNNLKSNNGLTLPRNPETLANLILKFHGECQKGKSKTYRDMIAELKELCDDEDVRYQIVYRLYRTMRQNLGREWRKSSIPTDNYPGLERYWTGVQNQLWHLAHILVEKQGVPMALTDATYEYCSSVKSHLSKSND